MNDTATDLPPQFAQMTGFLDWALTTETERLNKRLGSSMVEIQAFYDAMLPLAPQILQYLNEFELAELDPTQQTLMTMMLSLAEISAAVELYERPDHPFGFDMTRFVPGAP